MLSRDQVLHVARLARLELTDEEVERFGGELSKVLDYIETISELDLDDVRRPRTSSPSRTCCAPTSRGRRCRPRSRSRARPTRRRAASASRARGELMTEILDLTAAAGGGAHPRRRRSTPPSLARLPRARGRRRAQRLHLGRRRGAARRPPAARSAASRSRSRTCSHQGRAEPGRLEDPRGLPAAVHGDGGRAARPAPARRCWARPTRTSSRWAPRTRTPPTGRC